MNVMATRDFTNSMRPAGGPDTRFVEFKKLPMIDRGASKEAGRPIYVSKVFVNIQHPGDNNHVISRIATEADMAEFPAQWRAYSAGEEAIPEGTLLSVLFPQNPEIVENMRHFKLFTIEQLAGMADGQLQGIGMGGMKMRQDAQAYLKAAAGGADFHKLRDDVSKLMNELKASKDRAAALEGELARREAADKQRLAGAPAGQQQARAGAPR